MTHSLLSALGVSKSHKWSSGSLAEILAGTVATVFALFVLKQNRK